MAVTPATLLNQCRAEIQLAREIAMTMQLELAIQIMLSSHT